jgi:hypothetical protein
MLPPIRIIESANSDYRIRMINQLNVIPQAHAIELSAFLAALPNANYSFPASSAIIARDPERLDRHSSRVRQ